MGLTRPKAMQMAFRPSSSLCSRSSISQKALFTTLERQVILRFMFIGTQCDLWGKPDGTGHEKVSRGNFPRLAFFFDPKFI